MDHASELIRFEWVEQPGPGVRMKLRRDGTGFYEREGERFVRDNLLYEVEETGLRLKFAHAREWTRVGARLAPGSGKDRFGAWSLVLDRDPYVAVFEERTTGALALVSDVGAALLE